ncbi:MAG: tRNA lysidine(34) synthetase TilS, partial [Vicinamibacterales bacterium]
MSLIDGVRRTLEQHHLTTPSTRAVVALSGGPDSTALLHVLRSLSDSGALHLIAIAHLNHQLRDEADTDERFCAHVAADLGLAFVVERVNIREVARREHRSLEDAAHHVRHAFFERTVAACQAEVIAVGHTQGDQAETFLLRLIRGAGTRGLAGMHPRSGVVIRPLIDCSRDDVRAFLAQGRIAFLHDASNDDVSIPRNRVRAELLPLLASRFNPRIVETLVSEAHLAQADQQYFQEIVDAWMANHVTRSGPSTSRVNCNGLVALPRAVAWRVLHTLMRSAAGGGQISNLHVAQVWEAVVVGGARIDAPRHRVQRVGPDVVLTSRPAGSAGRPSDAFASGVPEFCRPLPVPGEVMIPEINCVMSAEIALSGLNAPPLNRELAIVPKDRVAGGLVVRNRRAGDRLRPSDVGHKKLQDLLVDRKVPRGARDQVPIVVDQAGHIVWVAGHAIDQDFQVSDPAQAVVILRLKAVG